MGKKGKNLRINKIAAQVGNFVDIIFITGGNLTNADKKTVKVDCYAYIIQQDIKKQCDAGIRSRKADFGESTFKAISETR